MAIRVQCPECDQVYQLKNELAGKSVLCKSCGGSIAVRAMRPAPNEDEFEVVEDGEDEFDDPVARPGRRSRSKSGIKIGGQKKNRSRDDNSRNVWPWLFGCLGAVILLVLLACGGLFFSARRAMLEVADGNPQFQPGPAAPAAVRADIPDAGPPTALYPVERYPLPTFPELGAWQPVSDSTVQVQSLMLQPPAEMILQPAFSTQMRVYMPTGEHAPGSLPLVLVAPAGTPLFIGSGLDDPGYHAETLPYAEAGAVVIMYSLDGGVIDLNTASDARLSLGYKAFRESGAGTVNARTALEFALAKIPAVDPKKIVVAGHSSAGTCSMLFAAHEPRLAAAIAYSPCTDVQTRMVDFASQVRGNPNFSDVESFIQKSSPRTHAANIQCPVFLFHSFDDTNCPYAESQQFLALLKSSGKDATLSEPPAFGDHYQPMIDEGIPRAIVWLRSRGIFLTE